MARGREAAEGLVECAGRWNATLPVGGRYGRYQITLFSGKAELVGPLGRNVVDLAIPLNQP